MMRLTMAVWWSLALVWLLAGKVEADSAPGQPARVEEVKGYGATVEIAKKNAVQAAALEVHRHAREHRLTHWRPTETFVAENLLDGPGRAGPDDTIADLVTKSWIHIVRIPDESSLRGLDRQAQRDQRAEERMSLTLRILAALVLALGLFVGTTRMDEWTHGRYTLPLRLVAAGVLISAGVGWWWVR